MYRWVANFKNRRMELIDKGKYKKHKKLHFLRKFKNQLLRNLKAGTLTTILLTGCNADVLNLYNKTKHVTNK